MALWDDTVDQEIIALLVEVMDQFLREDLSVISRNNVVASFSNTGQDERIAHPIKGFYVANDADVTSLGEYIKEVIIKDPGVGNFLVKWSDVEAAGLGEIITNDQGNQEAKLYITEANYSIEYQGDEFAIFKTIVYQWPSDPPKPLLVILYTRDQDYND